MIKGLIVFLAIAFVAILIASGVLLINYFSSNDSKNQDSNSEHILLKEEIKKHLLNALLAWIKENNFSQDQVAENLKISREAANHIIWQTAEHFTVDKLVELVSHADKHVRVSIQDKNVKKFHE